MVRSGSPDGIDGQQSLGELVALAAKDMSSLVRYEINLAKSELKLDARRIGIASALAGVGMFVACLVVVLLCFAYAFGLVAAGIWTWAAFLIVAGVWALVGALAVGIAYLRVRHMSGLRKTRETVSEGIGMLRPEAELPDGQRPEITAPKTG